MHLSRTQLEIFIHKRNENNERGAEEENRDSARVLVARGTRRT